MAFCVAREEMIVKKKSMKNVVWQNRGWLLLVIVSVIAYAGTEVFKAYVMQSILDTATAGTMEGLKKTIYLTIVFLFVAWLSYTAYGCCKFQFIKKCMITVKKQWFEDIQKKQLCDYDVQEASTYLSHFSADTTIIERDYLDNVITIIQYIITGSAALTVVLSVHYSFLVFCIITAWIPPVINLLWSKKLSNAKSEYSEENGNFIAFLKEKLSAFDVIKLFGISSKMSAMFNEENRKIEKKLMHSRIVEDVAENTSGITSLGIWFGNLVLGAFLTLNGVISIGEVLKVNQLLNHVSTPLYIVPSRLARMKAADNVYQKISEKLSQGAEEFTDTVAIGDKINHIKFNEIVFSKANRTILEQVNVSFEKGKKYLLVGDSGSGKSSLIKMLLNMYDEYEGEIRINGKNFKAINKTDWYGCISVVNQDNFVFHETIYNNLTLYQSYSQEEIHKVISFCELTELIDAHPEGLNFMIEENGKNISGGERQRICLARALLRKPAVLILDEATSALNSEMASKIEERILGLDQTIVISISHRVFEELKEKYDVVVKFENHTATAIRRGECV